MPLKGILHVEGTDNPHAEEDILDFPFFHHGLPLIDDRDGDGASHTLCLEYAFTEYSS